MIDFIKFDDLNKDHQKLARDNHEIIFEDNDCILRFGYLLENYNGNGTSSYLFISNGEKFNANCNYFSLIRKIK